MLTADQVAAALDAARDQLEAERRASFAGLGLGDDCLWPAARLYHRQSALGPAWRPALDMETIAALTHDGAYRTYPDAQRIALAAPPALNAPLEASMIARRSQTTFAERPVPLDAVAKLLQLGSGVTATDTLPRRAAPSGGALYPVETYLLSFNIEGLAPGVYHYLPQAHALEALHSVIGLEAAAAFLPPGVIAGRPALMIVLCAVFARTQLKYLERGYRFALLEAGHMVQNMLLAATAIGLGACPMGGFWDDPLNALLGVEEDSEAAIYGLVAGMPEADDG